LRHGAGDSAKLGKACKGGGPVGGARLADDGENLDAPLEMAGQAMSSGEAPEETRRRLSERAGPARGQTDTT
jgi:hypothetical protein